jgi:hypothetical protein
MSNPGLLFVASRITHPSKTTDEQFNQFYNDEHLPDVLNYKTKITDLALRYKNTSPSSDRPYLALYPLEDAAFFSTGTLEQLTEETKHSTTYDGANVTDFVHFDAFPYAKIQTFEHPAYTGKTQNTGNDRPRTLTCVAMEPAKGDEAEADFEAWYRKQHLDMLAMCEGYRRTTRYQRVDGVKPRFLALHEWACAPENLPAEQVKQVATTEWSLKILKEAEVYDRDVYELIEAQGDLGRKL